MFDFLTTLLAPAIWAASNHFNKYLLSRVMGGVGVGAIVIFAALVGVIVLPVALVLQQEAFTIGILQAVLIAFNGCLYLLALIPFLKALRISDASSVIPIFQLAPVISFVLARILLGEVLSQNQLLGGALVVSGALLISLEARSSAAGTKLKLRADAFGLMLLSTSLYAVSFVLFKAFAVKAEFWTTTFWESFGFICYAMVLLTCVRSYRDDFLKIFPRNRRVTGLVMINEVVNIVGKIVFNYFSLWVPLTLAWIGVSFQSVFVLIYSIALARLCPHISDEAVRGKQLLQKSVAIAIMVLGACIMYWQGGLL